MTNLPCERKRLMASAISWASAVESAPLPSRTTMPLTRLSRPAASNPRTRSITVPRRGAPGREDTAGRSGAVVDGLAQIQRQHHIAGQTVAARQGDHQQHNEDQK